MQVASSSVENSVPSAKALKSSTQAAGNHAAIYADLTR
jgi:hypothetical protein